MILNFLIILALLLGGYLGLSFIVEVAIPIIKMEIDMRKGVPHCCKYCARYNDGNCDYCLREDQND